MDSSSDSEELFPFVSNEYTGSQGAFRYDDPLLVSGVLRAVVEENLEKIKSMVGSGKSVNINDNNGNTPLHVAVIKNNLEILEYLLSQEAIIVNIRNFRGETPLFQAVKGGKSECARKLILAGANVNLPNYEDVTPLHVSVTHPDLTLLLIKSGAEIDPVDYSGDTPLHDATAEECLETVCMLLYYNADANAVGGNNLTPFMKALISEQVEIQEALFDYVDDFNAATGDNMTTLALALTHNTFYVEEIIKRGANVNYADYYCDDVVACAFTLCLRVPDPKKFKCVWDRLKYNVQRNSINIYALFKYLHGPELESYIQVIVDSENIQVAVDSLARNENFFLFINKYAENNMDIDMLTKLMCRLILHGYRATTYDMYSIFFNYGYCELFRILLYMDNNHEYGWLPHMAMPRIIVDVNYNLSDLLGEVGNMHNKEFEILVEYFIYPPLMDKYLGYYNRNNDVANIFSLPRVPCLVELARNKAREYISQRFKTSSSCQFYTIVNHLNISSIYKRILTLEKKLYTMNVSPVG